MVYGDAHRQVAADNDAGKADHIDFDRRRPCCSARVTALTVEPVVMTSSTSTTAASLEPAQRVGTRGEGAGDVALPRIGATAPPAAGCAACAATSTGSTAQAGEPAERPRQFGRLVVAPLELPHAMQRHRHQDRLLGPELGARRRHQPGAEPRQFRPVAILEPADDGARDLVVEHRRARPVERRRIGNRFGRARIGPERHLERDAEHRTKRRRDRPQLCETARRRAHRPWRPARSQSRQVGG